MNVDSRYLMHVYFYECIYVSRYFIQHLSGGGKKFVVLNMSGVNAH